MQTIPVAQTTQGFQQHAAEVIQTTRHSHGFVKSMRQEIAGVGELKRPMVRTLQQIIQNTTNIA